MDIARYFIRGRTFMASNPGLQDALARAYDSSERPRCMCVPGGVEMYVARHARKGKGGADLDLFGRVLDDGLPQQLTQS